MTWIINVNLFCLKSATQKLGQSVIRNNRGIRKMLSKPLPSLVVNLWTNFTSISWNSVAELGHVLGYRNVIRTLETSMNLIVQSNNSKIRAENVKSDFKIKM